MTAMVVDDNASIRGIIREMLTDTAQVTCECNDGSQALESYKKFHPDWVLMDIKMKIMDGFTATQEILSFDPQARVIMMTQLNDPALEEKALRLGAFKFIRKENLIAVEQTIKGRP